jgi:hypothetical protein
MPQDTIYGDGTKDRKKPEGPDQESLVRPFVNGYHDRKLMQFLHESMNGRMLLQMLRTIVVIHRFFQFMRVHLPTRALTALTHLSFFPTGPLCCHPCPCRRLSTLQRLSVAILSAAGGFNRRTLPGFWPRHPEGLLHVGPSCREARLSQSPWGAEPWCIKHHFPFQQPFWVLNGYTMLYYIPDDGFSGPFSGYFMTLMSDMEWPCHPARGRPRTTAVVKQICDQRGDDGNKIKWTSNLGCSPASMDVYWCILL